MADYKKMYLELFRFVTEAIEQLEQNNDTNTAIMLLKTAQMHCENIYLDTVQ